jgi:hypothetical protein
MEFMICKLPAVSETDIPELFPTTVLLTNSQVYVASEIGLKFRAAPAAWVKTFLFITTLAEYTPVPPMLMEEPEKVLPVTTEVTMQFPVPPKEIPEYDEVSRINLLLTIFTKCRAFPVPLKDI